MLAEEPIEPPHFARDIPAVGWEAHLEAALNSPHFVSMPKWPHCHVEIKSSDYRIGKVRSNEITSYECGAFGTGNFRLHVGRMPTPTSLDSSGSDEEALRLTCKASQATSHVDCFSPETAKSDPCCAYIPS